MTVSKVSDLNSLYNLIYNAALMTLREENIMVSNGLVTYYEGEGYADRKVPAYSSATVAVKPEGVDYTGSTVFSKSNLATLTPAVHMAQFLLTDEMVKTESVDNIVDKATTELAASIAEDVDENLVDTFTSFTTGVGSANSSLTLGIVGAAIARLRQAKVRGMTTVCLHPYGWHDIWTALGQPPATYSFLGETATEALRRYFVSNLQGATWITNANIDVDSSDDAIGLVFGKEALAFDLREAYALETERDASRKAVEYNASMGYAYGMLRDAAGIKVTHDATAPTS